MNHLIKYCWILTFSSTKVMQSDFEVRLCQHHQDTSARVLLGWKKVIVQAVHPRVQINFYVADIPFWWSQLYGHHLFYIPTSTVFWYYGSLAYASQIITFLRVIFLTEFDICAILRFIYGISRHRWNSRKPNFSLVWPLSSRAIIIVAHWCHSTTKPPEDCARDRLRHHS